jgi:hypothetical protein
VNHALLMGMNPKGHCEFLVTMNKALMTLGGTLGFPVEGKTFIWTPSFVLSASLLRFDKSKRPISP